MQAGFGPKIRPEPFAGGEQLDGKGVCFGLLSDMTVLGRNRWHHVSPRTPKATRLRLLMPGVEKVQEFMAEAKAAALRARIQVEKNLAVTALGGRNKGGLEIGQWLLANILYVERKRDCPHRNSAYSFAELFVNCFSQALRIKTHILKSYSIELNACHAPYAD